jgi:hypothetical protein
MTREAFKREAPGTCDNTSYQTCPHPQSARFAGVVPPVEPDGWSLDPLDHVWIACTRCGAVLRSAPYADELEREHGLGLPRPAPVEA